MKIFRVYPNGEIKDCTYVLYPHTEWEGFTLGYSKKTGYNGDVEAWSEHNKTWRGGCAQIQWTGEIRVLYSGACSDDVIQDACNRISEDLK